MNNLPFRQVHLDFHTSEEINHIGIDFSRSEFQKMLKIAYADSITLFSKCHHGWSYHPTKEGQMHPNLSFDLLKEMNDAAHEINVKTVIYLSAGHDERLVKLHPEWAIRDKNQTEPNFMRSGFHLMCLNNPYLDILIAQIKEALERYEAEGVFLDIVGVRKCYCMNCINTLLNQGKNPNNEAAVLELAEYVHANYTKRVSEIVKSVRPGLRIFHNGGHIERGRRDLAKMNTHLELESLPTGGWGYDHFPLSASYARNMGMEYLGMTGKFHTTWAEFGGYKHPNALRYEAALSIANGAKCSVGDQLHPRGKMDETTYRMIGKAYKELAAKEEWCDNVTSVADYALLSVESLGADMDWNKSNKCGPIDTGALRILQEGKFLFDVIDCEEDFNKYKVIILPDKIRINEDLKTKLEIFFKHGGKVFATGESGLDADGKSFAINLGVKWTGINNNQPCYFKPYFDLRSLEATSFVLYSQSQIVEIACGAELGQRENSYFNKELLKFCSHQHSPSTLEYSGPGMVESANGIYFAWNVFEEYADKGSITAKEIVIEALERLLPKRTLKTDLPAQGIVTLMNQKQKNRYVCHLLYVSPKKRGSGIEVVEDIIPIYNTTLTLKIPVDVKSVYLAPQKEDISYDFSDGVLECKVPKIDCHQIVVIDY